MKNYTKEIVYTLPYITEKDIRKAGKFRQKLYTKYESVMVYMNGQNEIKIIAKN